MIKISERHYFWRVVAARTRTGLKMYGSAGEPQNEYENLLLSLNPLFRTVRQSLRLLSSRY